jgi:alkanesulfonate monooxygenase SsuD/methylene tetrahydromethanopterin reductase-like flavin-dependent oxidoreductase (luciferase family)
VRGGARPAFHLPHDVDLGRGEEPRRVVSGPAEEVAAQLRQYQERGVSIFQLVVASPDQFGQMRRIAEVLPLLK